MAKNKVGTLYISAKSRLTTPLDIACKHQNIVNLPSPSSHVTLYFVSALRCKNSVVSSGIGGEIFALDSAVAEKLSSTYSSSSNCDPVGLTYYNDSCV